MGKFGKKNVVSTDLSHYMIGIIGPSGFGKSTLMYQTCDKLYGEEGYLILDMGIESGIEALNGAMYEQVSNFKLLNEIVMDIVQHKETEYPNLKVVVIDTLDAYFEVIEEYIIKDWNSNHANDNGFTKAKSINSVEGGFGRGMDRVIDTAKKVVSKLNSVGVGVWWTAHIKEKDMTDIYTGTTYTQLTANMSKKYFDSIKNSSHVVACGYYDRSIEKVEIGDENPITKKKKQRSTVVDETRKIKFRDDMLVADAKSRFAKIIDEIPLDADAFIKAIQDAIVNSSTTEAATKTQPVQTSVTKSASVKTTPVPQNLVDIQDVTDITGIDDDVVKDLDLEETDFDRATAITGIRDVFPGLTVETKAEIKKLLNGAKLEQATDDIIKKIQDIIEKEAQIIE